MNIRPVGAEFFQADRKKDVSYTKPTKILLSFRSLVNASKDRNNENVGRNKWPRYTVVLFTCRQQ